MTPYLDIDIAEWLLAGVAAIGVIVGAIIEYRRDSEKMMDMEVRLRVLEAKVEALEESNESK